MEISRLVCLASFGATLTFLGLSTWPSIRAWLVSLSRRRDTVDVPFSAVRSDCRGSR
jgi:hypothetical protein